MSGATACSNAEFCYPLTTLYHMINSGELVPAKIGRHTPFDKRDLGKYIDAVKGLPLDAPRGMFKKARKGRG